MDAIMWSMTPAPSWAEQLFGNPTALFALLAFLAAAVAACATWHYAITARRMVIDASNPRLAISVGNVGWPPMKTNVLGQLVSQPRRKWTECVAGDPIHPRAFDDRYACHTVARLSNDGTATAYVRWTVKSGGLPEWTPKDSIIFRVTDEDFTVPPGREIDVTLYPAMTADQWSQATGAVTVTWKVEVYGQSLPRVVDRTSIVWKIDDPAVGSAGQLVWAKDPHRSCSVDNWRRSYAHRWRMSHAHGIATDSSS